MTTEIVLINMDSVRATVSESRTGIAVSIAVNDAPAWLRRSLLSAVLKRVYARCSMGIVMDARWVERSAVLTVHKHFERNGDAWRRVE